MALFNSFWFLVEEDTVYTMILYFTIVFAFANPTDGEIRTRKIISKEACEAAGEKAVKEFSLKVNNSLRGGDKVVERNVKFTCVPDGSRDDSKVVG